MGSPTAELLSVTVYFLVDKCIVTLITHDRRGQGPSGALFYQSTDPICETRALMTSLRLPLNNTITLKIKISPFVILDVLKQLELACADLKKKITVSKVSTVGLD